MVTGFHLSMSEPSRLSLGLCMLRATFDKAAWLEDHGVGEEWPTSGLPETIGVDNGSDFKSTTFRRACENEGIRVRISPARPAALRRSHRTADGNDDEGRACFAGHDIQQRH